MYKYSSEQKIYFVLRIAIAMCFIGHGAFGIITKPIWANYFAVFGIGHDMAYTLMPWVGAVDIALGITMLVYPVRAIALWLIGWGFFTAALRPLSGEPVAEFIERAGNFGAPVCLLMLIGGSNTFKGWFALIKPGFAYTEVTRIKLTAALRVLVFLLLAGHGWLNLLHKQGLINQYISLGFNDAHQVSITAGFIEIFAAFIVLVRPAAGVLFLLFIWKAATELFYPHYEIVEWVERGGSYGCILALLMTLQTKPYVGTRIQLPFLKLNYKNL